MWETISNFFSAISGFFGYAKQRDAEKNAAGMVDAKQNQSEVDAQAQVAKDLAKKDVTSLEKDISD